MAKKDTKSKIAGTSPEKASATMKPSARKHTGPPAKTAKGKVPTHEEIAQKAHDIYQERMLKGEPGDPESDWQQALDILKASK
jgi:hypothetical protein